MTRLEFNKTITMRPHHFLCLPGYKGYSYNKEHATSWDNISQMTKEHPYMNVQIIEGQDSLCQKCPNTKDSATKCNENFINQLDKKVKNLLGLNTGQIYGYQNVVNRLREILTPDTHAELCKDCYWRNFGLCQDTFEKK